MPSSLSRDLLPDTRPPLRTNLRTRRPVGLLYPSSRPERMLTRPTRRRHRSFPLGSTRPSHRRATLTDILGTDTREASRPNTRRRRHHIVYQQFVPPSNAAYVSAHASFSPRALYLPLYSRPFSRSPEPSAFDRHLRSYHIDNLCCIPRSLLSQMYVICLSFCCHHPVLQFCVATSACWVYKSRLPTERHGLATRVSARLQAGGDAFMARLNLANVCISAPNEVGVRTSLPSQTGNCASLVGCAYRSSSSMTEAQSRAFLIARPAARPVSLLPQTGRARARPCLPIDWFTARKAKFWSIHECKLVSGRRL